MDTLPFSLSSTSDLANVESLLKLSNLRQVVRYLWATWTMKGFVAVIFLIEKHVSITFAVKESKNVQDDPRLPWLHRV